MATKWKKTYTDISNVNGGNEYETGDHITKETVNVALNNTAYLQQTKVTAESNKGLVTQQILVNTDLNTVKTNGFYGVAQNCTNKPVNKNDGNLIVLQYDSSNIWTTQVYITLNLSENKNRIYSRGYNNSTNSWSSWKQIDNDPSLYNLGAYDTYVDNGDGTTTITRQTGYWNSNNAAVNVAESYHYTNGMRVQYDKVSNIDSGEGEGKAKSNWAYGFEMISKPSNINYNSTAIWLGFPYIFVNGKADLTSALEYINKNPVSIEYKLATPYTETIITGVPQITLDKQGCEWLRSEWEKGLNLLNIDNISNNSIIYSNLPTGTYTFSLKTTGDGDGFNLKINSLSGDTIGSAAIKNGYGVVTFTVTRVVDLYFNGWGNAWTNYDIMLVKGSVPYPYQPYNSSYHITNEQANLLVEEEEKSRNLLIENFYKYNDNYRMNLGYCELKANTIYCLSTSSNITSRILIVVGSQENVLTTYSFTNKLAFTPTRDYKGNLVLQGTFTDIALPTWAILNKGSEPLPYVAYNGSIVHEKQLSLQAPSMGHKVANECMMNVTGEYYNNSSSDVYILLGNIKPAYKEARDGGFIISGTIGQYYYTQQAQINAVAYWRDKVKWKGLYTQDNSDGNFNNIVDLIITTTNKIYLVIKAGQFGQYNLQLQGVTIQYTGNILTAKEGSTASTFSQSDAIDLTALDTGLSDKLKFIDNNAITDPDGNGNYKVDNNYIYDEELATNGVDYTPFDGSSSYDSQSGINQDFYKQIKTNKEDINSLRGRSLYVNTITMQFTSPDKAVVTLTILDTLPHDDPSSGTSWSFVRDYLNNKGYVLGSYTNWQKTNKVYPCSGSINISSSVQFPIVGISKDSSTNGLFWLHYLAYDGSPVAIAFSTVINSRAHSIQIF